MGYGSRCCCCPRTQHYYGRVTTFDEWDDTVPLDQRGQDDSGFRQKDNRRHCRWIFGSLLVLAATALMFDYYLPLTTLACTKADDDKLAIWKGKGVCWSNDNENVWTLIVNAAVAAGLVGVVAYCCCSCCCCPVQRRRQRRVAYKQRSSDAPTIKYRIVLPVAAPLDTIERRLHSFQDDV